MRIEDIKILSLNSFFGSNILAHFLSGCKDNKIKFELAFVVLPIIYQSKARCLLASGKRTSTLDSILLGRTDGKISLSNIDAKIDYFKALTQKSLVVAANNYGVLVKDFVHLSGAPDYRNTNDNYAREYYKASHYLGHILSINNYLETLLKLGVHHI